MFGYVKPHSPLLRVKDDEFYKALYCGLCGCTSKCNGCSSTVTLSYDVAFLALLRLALAGEKHTIIKKRCIAHPLKKKKRVAPCDQLELCSSIGVLLSYYKILDNINDEKGAKRLAAKIMKPFFARSRKRIIKKQGSEADDIIRNGLEQLSRIEEQRLKSVDLPSDAFGDMLGKLSAVGLEGRNRIIAESTGRALGKWIYIIDAIDDVCDDEKSNSYNPVLELYDRRCPSRDELSDISLAMEMTLERLRAALDLIDYTPEDESCEKNGTEAYFSDELRSVIDNVINVGIPKTQQRIINAERK